MEDYLKMAAGLKDALSQAEGFIRSERFSSLAVEGKLLSMSVWKDEASVERWRNLAMHRMCQKHGSNGGFCRLYHHRCHSPANLYHDRAHGSPGSTLTVSWRCDHALYDNISIPVGGHYPGCWRGASPGYGLRGRNPSRSIWTRNMKKKTCLCLSRQNNGFAIFTFPAGIRISHLPCSLPAHDFQKWGLGNSGCHPIRQDPYLWWYCPGDGRKTGTVPDVCTGGGRRCGQKTRFPLSSPATAWWARMAAWRDMPEAFTRR